QFSGANGASAASVGGGIAGGTLHGSPSVGGPGAGGFIDNDHKGTVDLGDRRGGLGYGAGGGGAGRPSRARKASPARKATQRSRRSTLGRCRTREDSASPGC